MATGITQRHSKSCSHKGRCSCPYDAWIFDANAVTKSGKRGAKVRQTFGSAAEAKAWRGEASAIAKRSRTKAPTATLKQAAEHWLGECERGEAQSRKRRNFKPSTLRGYRRSLGTYVYPDLGARRLDEIHARDLQALVKRLNGQGLAGSTVRNVVVPLMRLYHENRMELDHDPTIGLDLPKPGRRRERAASPGEAAKLLAALPLEDRALWATALYAGPRLGELRALRARDVDPERSVTIEHGWDVKDGEITPKSDAGVRVIPVPATLAAILAEHLERSGRSGGELIFGRTSSAPFTDSHMRKRAREAWANTCQCGHVASEHRDEECG